MYKGCPTGNIRVTDSFNLKKYGIKRIIHGVGPNIELGKKPTTEDQKNLRDVYHASLWAAEIEKYSSIALPFISSNIYNYPKQEAARIALEEFIKYPLPDNFRNTLHGMDSYVKDIYFILFTKEEFELVLQEINNIS